MAGDADPLSVLPISDAAQGILHADPVLGGITVLLVAAVVAQSWFIVRLIRDKDADAKARDGALAEAKAEHIEDLKVVIPALHDLKEKVLELLASRSRRT